MPAPLVVPAIAAAASLIGSGMNMAAQGKMNKKSIQYNKEMYAQQRADALADFNMQNEYNSPTSQMARLREAGLNPNLVYGQGADNTAQAVRSSSQGQPDLHNPMPGNMLTTPLSSYYDARMKQAQTDNLKVQNTVLEQEAALKAATTGKLAVDTARSEFDLNMAQSLKDNSLEMATESLRKLKTGTDVQLQENERAAAQNSANLKIAAETILNMRATRANTDAERKNIEQQLQNLKSSGKLQELDIELKKMGVQPSDNLFFRILGRLLNGDWENLPKLFKPNIR